jgi:hypothetical protein
MRTIILGIITLLKSLYAMINPCPMFKLGVNGKKNHLATFTIMQKQIWSFQTINPFIIAEMIPLQV